MRKVLHRSFKPAKCKITLQMATSRLKILKNKKDTQIKLLRREVAQLLESGQTQTAEIRVEHVVREEKTVAAYELVGIYCELLVARLALIDSHKDCPNDLKEAVASVLYATRQLSDVSELSDVVKHFTAKYGKDFVSAAIGLHPSSGVSRLLVDKLSVKAPDGPTKNKILTEIAKEHNVTWEAEPLVESDPKEPVLSSGASSSQPVSAINSDSSRIPSNLTPATVSAQQTSYAVDGRSSSQTTSTDFNIGKTADVHHQDPRPSGDRTDGRGHRHPNPSYGDSSVWETEFVDATSAARAAAESAERASFAARAAAELSSKERMMMMQNSTESHYSSSFDTLRNEPPHRHSSSSDKQSGCFTNEEMLRTGNRQEDQSTIGAEASEKTVDELSGNASWQRDHSWENSVEMRLSESSAKIGREEKKPSMDDIKLSSSEDVPLNRQSSNISDDNNITTSDHTEAPSIWEENRIQSSVKDTESHDHGPDIVVAPAFDDYNSFFDKPQFDTEDVHHEEAEQGLGFSLLGSSNITPDHMPTETNSWSFQGHESPKQPSSASTSQVLEKEKEKLSSPLFDDGPMSPPLSLHEPEPSAKFDDYDPDSESEEDVLRNKEKVSAHVEENPKLTSHKSLTAEVPDDLGRYFFPSDTEDQGDDSKTQEESDAETPTATGLEFGPLAGGFKNEMTLPTYETSPPRDKTSSKSLKEDVPTEVDMSRSSLQTVSSSSIRNELLIQEATNTDKRLSSIPLDASSSDDESEMAPLERFSIRNQDKRTESRTRPTHLQSQDYEEKIPTRVSTRSPERTQKTVDASVSYLHSVYSDDEDEKEVRRDAAPIHTKPTNSRLSRRTKGTERKAFPVTAKMDNVSHDKESPPKLIPEAKPLAKQQVSASSSSFPPKTDNAFHGHESPPKLSSSSSSLPKTEKVIHYRESPPKQTPEDNSLAKQEVSASSSSLPKSEKVLHYQESSPKRIPEAKQEVPSSSSSFLPKTEKVSHYWESPPKRTPEAKSLAKQGVSASSSSSLPKSEKVLHYQESSPKRTPEANQKVSSSFSSSLPKTEKVSRYGGSPPKRTPENKSQAKQEVSSSSSSSLPKTVTSPDPETPAKEKASHVHPKLPDYDDIFAKLGALRR